MKHQCIGHVEPSNCTEKFCGDYWLNHSKIICFYLLHIQHTIFGKVAYAPTVGRLDCGAFPSDPYGFWQVNGYGILSVFKKDWDRFGGKCHEFLL